MTKVVTPGYTDTPIEGVSSLNFPRGLVNIKQDFRVKSNTGKEVVLTNLTSPIDRPENIRLAYTDIANIYGGTGIESSLSAPSKRGVSVLAQVTDVISVSDSTDADYRIDLPMSAHLVLKVPASEHITSAQVQALVGRLLSCLFDTGSVGTARLEAILRGSLVPSELYYMDEHYDSDIERSAHTHTHDRGYINAFTFGYTATMLLLATVTIIYLLTQK